MKSSFILSFLIALVLSVAGGAASSFALNQADIVQIAPAVPTAILLPFNMYACLKAGPMIYGNLLHSNFGLANLGTFDQKENPGGLEVIGYIIPIADLADPIPSLKAHSTIANNTDATVLQGSFTPKQGKNFIEVYRTMDTPEVRSEMVGELDGKTYQHVMDGFIPGMDENVEAFGRMIASTKLIAIAVTVDGKRKVVGSKAFPAYANEVNMTTGKATSDRRGITFSLMSRGMGPAPFYNGTIALSGTTVPALGT